VLKHPVIEFTLRKLTVVATKLGGLGVGAGTGMACTPVVIVIPAMVVKPSKDHSTLLPPFVPRLVMLKFTL
jgi:hypothetical protein